MVYRMSGRLRGMHEAAPGVGLVSRVACCVLRVAAHRARNEPRYFGRTACRAEEDPGDVKRGAGALLAVNMCKAWVTRAAAAAQ
eukprot:800879-Prymnesium_polylepis.1